MKCKRLVLLGIPVLAAIALSGCAGHIAISGGAYPAYPGPVVVHPAPVVVEPAPVVVLDYWYDGYRYYYRDSGTSLYFYWHGGSRVYQHNNWYPRHNWHRRDHNWRHHDPHWRHGGGHQHRRW